MDLANYMSAIDFSPLLSSSLHSFRRAWAHSLCLHLGMPVPLKILPGNVIKRPRHLQSFLFWAFSLMNHGRHRLMLCWHMRSSILAHPNVLEHQTDVPRVTLHLDLLAWGWEGRLCQLCHPRGTRECDDVQGRWAPQTCVELCVYACVYACVCICVCVSKCMYVCVHTRTMHEDSHHWSVAQ